MTDRRTNWLHRQFIDQIVGELAAGRTTARDAAERMRARLVPLEVAVKVVRSTNS